MKEMTWFVIGLDGRRGPRHRARHDASRAGHGKGDQSRRSKRLARQPEAEKSITRTLFVGLAMIESLSIYCLVVVLIILFRNPLLQYLLKP